MQNFPGGSRLRLSVPNAEGQGSISGQGTRYTHLNAKFQRIARRDKKAFLSDQCKEIEGNNRMGKRSPQEN